MWGQPYAPTTVEWKAAGMKLEMETTFPEGETALLKITGVESPKERTLCLRRPTWAREGFSISVNGQAIKDFPKAGSYVEIGFGDLIGDVQQAKIRIRKRNGSVFHSDAIVTAEADRVRADMREQSAVAGCRCCGRRRRL